MRGFRLIIFRSPAGGEVIGYSDPVDLVTGLVTQRLLMGSTPHGVAMLPNTRPLEREAAEFWRHHPLKTVLQVGTCANCSPAVPLGVSPETPREPPAPEPPKSEGCDGK